MTHHFFDVAFTSNVRKAQKKNGSADAYGRFMSPDTGPDTLSAVEASFISMRDSFYMASVSETGWPYVQHRGGPIGFIKILGTNRIGIPDFRGNRQYVSVGNFAGNNCVSLFFMDYPNKRRLKVMARSSVVDIGDDDELAVHLTDADYKAKVERFIIFDIEAFDWNCPQHITQRFTFVEIENLTAEQPWANVCFCPNPAVSKRCIDDTTLRPDETLGQ